MSTQEEINSIDRAISTCDEYINVHRHSSTRMLILLVQIGVVVLTGLIGFVYMFYKQLFGMPVDGVSHQTVVSSPFVNTIIFALLAIFALVFGVLMAVYRFHLNEVSKSEHYKIGFMRIRIAANNNASGFQSEVRQSLTEKAFAFQSSSGFIKGRNVESPLPGHPTSDAAAIILDKLFDKIESLEKKIDKQ